MHKIYIYHINSYSSTVKDISFSRCFFGDMYTYTFSHTFLGVQVLHENDHLIVFFSSNSWAGYEKILPLLVSKFSRGFWKTTFFLNSAKIPSALAHVGRHVAVKVQSRSKYPGGDAPGRLDDVGWNVTRKLPENERTSTLKRDHKIKGNESSEPTIHFRGYVSFKGVVIYRDILGPA